MIELEPRALFEIVVRAALVYVALMVMLRMAGKRELGQMSVFDLVVVLIIANAVQNAMVGSDTSLTGGLIAAATLILVNRLVNRVAFRISWIDRGLTGSPTLLVHDGQLVNDHLIQEGVTVEEVMMGLREHGIDSLDEVQSAILEVDGTISVIATDQPVHRTRRRVRGRKRAG